jgi:hypothetical protein
MTAYHPRSVCDKQGVLTSVISPACCLVSCKNQSGPSADMAIHPPRYRSARAKRVKSGRKVRAVFQDCIKPLVCWSNELRRECQTDQRPIPANERSSLEKLHLPRGDNNPALRSPKYFTNERKGVRQMKLTRILVALPLIAVCCMAQDVRYNFAASQDFSKFRTYKWIQIAGTDKINQLAEQQLQAAVDAQLSAKGLSKTDNDSADLLIGYQAAIGQEKQYTSFNSDWGYGPGWYGHGMGGGGMTTGETSTIHIGQVTLDMYDPAQKQLVWRGSVSKTLDTKAKPDKQTKNLNKAIAKLLKNFPPPAKKS